MKRQHGQSAVEFALMAPIIFMMIFGMIYGGIMFMEYLHYSNAVRTAAREIAIKPATWEERRAWLENLYQEEISVKLYTPKVSINFINITTNDAVENVADADAVRVTVSFRMEDKEFYSLPGILRWIGFPPRSINTLEYRMRLERQE